MPSKRTNDSVDRILQELGQKQSAEGIRDHMTDRQVDEILASVGIDVGGTGALLEPIPDDDLPTPEVGGGKPAESIYNTAMLDEILGDLPSLRSAKQAAKPTVDEPGNTKNQNKQAAQPAPRKAPAPQREYSDDAIINGSAQGAAAPPAADKPQGQRAAGTAAPQNTPAEAAGQAAETTAHRSGTAAGDTTRTGIIKNFLIKMAPEGAEADPEALDKGKEKFVKYFGKSVAVVKDDKGRLRDPSRKKKGLFGLPTAEETGEFEPISVSFTNRSPKREEQPLQNQQPSEEYYPDEPEEPTPQELPEPQPEPQPEQAERRQQPKPKRKKKGFFAGLFGGAPADEELIIPEPREEPVEEDEPPQQDYTAAVDAAGEQPAAAPPEESTSPDLSRTVFRSKYSAKAGDSEDKTGMTLGGDTLGFLREAINRRPGSPTAAEGGQANTVYRKKRSTVEFMPGKKSVKPQQTPVITNVEPVGEPVMTSDSQIPPYRTTTGFTVQMDGGLPAENTQDFLAELTAEPDARRTADAAPGAYGYDAEPEYTEPEYTEPEYTEPQYEDEDYPQGYAAPKGSAGADAVPELGTEEDTSTFEDIPVNVAQTLTGQVRYADIQARAATLAGDTATEKTQTQSQTGEFAQGLDMEPQPSEINTSDFVRGIAKSINFDDGDAPQNAEPSQEIPDDDGRYAEAVSRLRGETADADEAPKPKKHKGINLGGVPDDEQESITEPFAAQRGIKQDYDTPDDAAAVRAELDKQVLLYGLGVIICGILGAAMLYFGTAAVGNVLPLPAALNPAAGKTPLLAVMLVMLAACCAISWKTLLDGALGLFKNPTPDSMPTLAAAGALVQLVFFLVQPDMYDTTRFCLLAGPAALLLCFNNIGKLLCARTAAANFRLVSAGVEHAVAYRLRDASVLRAVTGGLAEPHPCVLVSRPTQLLKRFLASSASGGTSDKNQQQFAWIVGVCGLIGFLFTLLYRKDAGMAVTTLAAALCIGAPLGGTLLSALPMRLMQRSAAQVGAVIPGWRDIRQLGKINVIEVTARDLFPAGTVKLGGIKAINDDHIYTAIVYAASLLADAGESMREVFLGMIGDTSKQLCKVDDLQNVYGKGCIGWINGERALIGNRALMQDYDIKLPDLAYEQRHTVNQRRVIYLAVSGKLFAMFQVCYERDPDTAIVLDSLRHSGMSLIVDCDDFNVDAHLLETAYGLPVGSVKILSGAEREAMAPATAWLPESEGSMLHLGSFASFVGGLEAAAGAAEGERKSALVLSASVLLSCLLAVIMALAGGLAALPLPALVLYQAAWAVLALIFPLLQRY